MSNPFQALTRRERMLWLGSLLVILAANLTTAVPDPLTLVTALVGVTSLSLAAKGNVWSQILMILFSVLYGVISFRFRYWGEMMTYLGMTLPMAIWSTVTWLKNPSNGSGSPVAIRPLTLRCAAALAVCSAVVTGVFFRILSALNTPNLLFSTVSILTSFLAAALTMLRSSYYAIGYAANDLVLIVLWTLAAARDPVYFPVAVNFCIFFLNDLYGFWCWRQRECPQAS